MESLVIGSIANINISRDITKPNTKILAVALTKDIFLGDISLKKNPENFLDNMLLELNKCINASNESEFHELLANFDDLVRKFHDLRDRVRYLLPALEDKIIFDRYESQINNLILSINKKKICAKIREVC